MYLRILVGCQDLVDSFFTQQVILQIVGILTAPRGRRRVHPFQFLRSLLPSLLLLQSLKLLELSFFFFLLPQLIKFLLLFQLKQQIKVNCDSLS